MHFIGALLLLVAAAAAAQPTAPPATAHTPASDATVLQKVPPAADPAMRRWSPWSPDGREIPPAVTALPSVTEFSRFSLISGNLAN